MNAERFFAGARKGYRVIGEKRFVGEMRARMNWHMVDKCGRM